MKILTLLFACLLLSLPAHAQMITGGAAQLWGGGPITATYLYDSELTSGTVLYAGLGGRLSGLSNFTFSGASSYGITGTFTASSDITAANLGASGLTSGKWLKASTGGRLVDSIASDDGSDWTIGNSVVIRSNNAGGFAESVYRFRAPNFDSNGGMFTWVGDENTGMQSGGDGVIDLNINGAIRLTLNAAGLQIDEELSSDGTGTNYFMGKLGIGTASPSVTLDVQAPGPVTIANFKTTTGGTGQIYQSMANTGGTVRLGIESSTGGSAIAGGLPYSTFLDSTGSTVLHLGANNAVAMTITTAQRVMVGTTTDDGANVLQVNGGLAMIGNSTDVAAGTGVTLWTNAPGASVGQNPRKYMALPVNGTTYYVPLL